MKIIIDKDILQTLVTLAECELETRRSISAGHGIIEDHAEYLGLPHKDMLPTYKALNIARNLIAKAEGK